MSSCLKDYPDRDKIAFVTKAYAGQFPQNFKNVMNKSYEESHKEDCFNEDYIVFFIKSNSDPKIREKNIKWFNDTFIGWYYYTVDQGIFNDMFGPSSNVSKTSVKEDEVVEESDDSDVDGINGGLFDGDDGW